MDAHARPLEADDAPDIETIDADYARAFALEPRAGTASLRFFARTGHAFVAERRGAVCGFVLAQAVFDGERPTVFAARLASRPLGDREALRALVRALTKSAYDAGVYDLRVELPERDAAAAAALAGEGYAPAPVSVQVRQLGSRGAAAAAGADGAHARHG